MENSNSNYMDARNWMVVKRNDLIMKSRFNLSLQQQKIVLYLISQITPYDEEFKKLEFSISDFCKVCGMDETSGKNYKNLKDSIKDIADQSVWVDMGDGKETLIRWIEKPYINKQKGTIQIRLDEDLKPYLLQLKSNYTQYELFWTLRFRSKYSVRLFELVNSIHYHDLETYERIFTLDELRLHLGLYDEKNKKQQLYKTYNAFKTRVLDPACEEINNYSNKNVSYVPIKNGRSVEKIRLIVSTKDTMETLKLRGEIEHELGMDAEQMSFYDELVAKGHIPSPDKKDVIEIEPVEEV